MNQPNAHCHTNKDMIRLSNGNVNENPALSRSEIVSTGSEKVHLMWHVGHVLHCAISGLGTCAYIPLFCKPHARLNEAS